MNKPCLAFGMALLLGSFSAAAAVFTVTNTAPSGPGSLYESVIVANTNPGPDTIVFAVTSGATIVPTNELSIVDDLAIVGPSPNVLTISGGSSHWIFIIYNNTASRLSITGLTLVQGHSPLGGGALYIDGAHVSLTNCVLSGNVADTEGGAIAAFGADLTLVGCTVRSNSASSFGGGIYADLSTINLIRCTVNNNICTLYGGGLCCLDGTVGIVENSTFSGNRSDGDGGGIYSDTSGGSPTIAIRSSTIAFNSAPQGRGGGIRHDNGDSVLFPSLLNTIIAGNAATNGGPDLSGGIQSQGHNLIGNSSGGFGFVPTDRVNTNAQLAALANNGGPTWTHALLNTSPAIDAGDNTNAPPTDQRGFTRIAHGIIDIGAYETQVTSFNVSLTPEQDGGPPRTGFGSGVVTLFGNVLHLNITYSGLSANSTAAHIHGPASTGQIASVLYNLAGLTTFGSTSGSIIGDVTLAAGTSGFTLAQQLSQLNSNLWYINVHSTNFPAGEIRGQIIAAASTSGPSIQSVNPAPGTTISSLTNITVQFTEPVGGVDASDLLINGSPATVLAVPSGNTSSNDVYIFGFPQPPYGNVSIAWSTNHAIADFDSPPKPFNASAPGSTWQYTLNANTPPTITCSGFTMRSNDVGQCSAVVTFSPSATGNPAPTVTCSPPSGSTFPVGTNAVSCTASNSAGTANCSFLVAVLDAEPPAISCVGNKSAECGTTWTFDRPTATDNCDGTNVTVVVAGTVTNAFCGKTFSATRTWKATDSAGNSNVCAQTVTVVDTTAPSITCAPNRTVECGTPWNFDAPTAFDSCEGPLALVAGPQCNPGPATGGGTDRCYDDGYVYVDSSNNAGGYTWNWGYQSASQVQSHLISFHRRTTSGSNTTQIITDTYDLGGVAPPPAPYSGTFGGPGPQLPDVPVSRSIQPVPPGGTIMVVSTLTNQLAGSNYRVTRTWKATDGCGNSNFCSQAITVVDTTPPQIVCATNITRECAGPAGTPVSFAPVVTDNCDPNVAAVCTPASGSLFARGTTGVTCVATDANTNSSQCTFTVTIGDTTPPQLTCPSNIIAAEEPRDSGSATVSFSDPTATDVCDGSATASCVPPSGSSFPIGTNTVVCTAADATGNTNSCAFTVRVIPYRLRIVTSTASAGTGSLRRAILDANDAPGENLIVFEIPAPGPYVINLPSPLPEITSPLIIDGYSQTGSSNAPLIELRGNGEGDGLVITAGSSTVQGLILNGFTTAIRLAGNGGNIIRGNFIGTDFTGSLLAGNLGDGIFISSPTNIIGGVAPGAGNLISGNIGSGIHLRGIGAVRNLIQGNIIGTAIDRTSGLGNGLDGIFVDVGAARNSIGGSLGNVGNLIAYNGRNGVSLDAEAGSGNSIRRNSIKANAALGIDLGSDGVTANDADDTDAGPNNLQNFPVLTDARSVDGITTIEGTLNDVPDGAYQLDFFLNDTADPSGFGEGALYLGSTSVSVLNGGSHDFSFSVPISATYTQFVAATATDTGNNTSEFSQAVQVRTAPTLLVQPEGTNAPIGAEVVFCATAVGTPPIHWQWRHNGINVEGANTRCYTIPIASLQDGGSYTVVAFNDLGVLTTIPAALRLPITNAAPPGADYFADRVQLFGTNGFAAGSNESAVNGEPGEPLHAGKRGGKSVWYTWTAGFTGIVAFRTTGSTFDTLLGIYTGNAVDQLETVAFDEDRGGFFTSGVRFNIVRNQEYHIAIDGFGGDTGQFILNWTAEDTQRLLPQIRTQPQSQTVAPGADVTFVVVAERVCGQGHLNCPDPSHFPDEELRQLEYLWYFNDAPIAPPQTNNILQVSNVQLDKVGRYSCSVTYAGQTIQSEDASLQMNLVGGSEVQNVQAYDKFLDAAESDPLRLGFTSGSGAIAPPGKHQPSAVGGFVSGYTGLQTFSSTGSTTEGTETSCGTLGGASDWIKFIVAAPVTLGFTTAGTSFETVLALYAKTNATTPFKLVTCGRNTLTVPVTNGVQYMVGCDGVNGAMGSVQLACNALVSATLTAVERTPQGYFTLQVVGQPGIHFSLQGSSSFGSWTTIVTTTSATGTTNITDTTAPPFSSRFYRVQTLP